MTETLQPEARVPFSTFPELVAANRAFEADRPLLGARNHPGLVFTPHHSSDPNPDARHEPLTDVKRVADDLDLSVIQGLLIGEISEFNGGAEAGYFARPENREDYRQQEVADMVLFALTYYLEMAIGHDGQVIEPNQERIEKRTQFWLDHFEIPVVPPTVPAGRVERFSAAAEVTFEQLKYLLNMQRDILSQAKTTELTPADIEKTCYSLEKIISLCFAMFHLMGKHPIKQMGEKVGRNQLKHLARLLSIEYVPQLPESLSLSERKVAMEQAYRPQATKARNLWDGLPDSQGQRPGLGTDDFYSQGLMGQSVDVPLVTNQEFEFFSSVKASGHRLLTMISQALLANEVVTSWQIQRTKTRIAKVAAGARIGEGNIQSSGAESQIREDLMYV